MLEITGSVAALCTSCCNILKLCILPTQCTCVFLMIPIVCQKVGLFMTTEHFTDCIRISRKLRLHNWLDTLISAEETGVYVGRDAVRHWFGEMLRFIYPSPHPFPFTPRQEGPTRCLSHYHEWLRSEVLAGGGRRSSSEKNTDGAFLVATVVMLCFLTKFR
jgi:hypothetical protein